MLQHAYDFRDPGVLVHSNKSAETSLVKWSPVRHGSGGSLKVAALAWQDLVVPTLRMAADHGEFCIPLSASIHVNLRPREDNLLVEYDNLAVEKVRSSLSVS